MTYSEREREFTFAKNQTNPDLFFIENRENVIP